MQELLSFLLKAQMHFACEVNKNQSTYVGPYGMLHCGNHQQKYEAHTILNSIMAQWFQKLKL